MKHYKLVFIFLFSIVKVSAQDKRWHYALGYEFKPEVHLIEDDYMGWHNRTYYGYSTGPGFIMDRPGG